jgi:hypothetical protein
LKKPESNWVWSHECDEKIEAFKTYTGREKIAFSKRPTIVGIPKSDH